MIHFGGSVIGNGRSVMGMESLQTSAARMLASVLKNMTGQPPTPGKVALAWHVAAGPALGRAGTPRWTPDGTLRIVARDKAWAREIARARPVITERLRQVLGPDVVTRLIVDESS
jgi:hypothetical protein